MWDDNVMNEQILSGYKTFQDVFKDDNERARVHTKMAMEKLLNQVLGGDGCEPPN